MADEHERGFHFNWTLSIGNLFTIIGGIAALAIFLWNTSAAYQQITGQLVSLQGEINDVRCALAFAGISTTSTPCTIPSKPRN